MLHAYSNEYESVYTHVLHLIKKYIIDRQWRVCLSDRKIDFVSRACPECLSGLGRLFEMPYDRRHLAFRTNRRSPPPPVKDVLQRVRTACTSTLITIDSVWRNVNCNRGAMEGGRNKIKRGEIAGEVSNSEDEFQPFSRISPQPTTLINRQSLLLLIFFCFSNQNHRRSNNKNNNFVERRPSCVLRLSNAPKNSVVLIIVRVNRSFTRLMCKHIICFRRYFN